MSQTTNPNYEEKDDGWYKKDQSVIKGYSPFNKLIRTTASTSPCLYKRTDGSTDWNKMAEAIQRERGYG